MTRGLAAGPWGDPSRYDVAPSAALPPAAGGNNPRAISMFRTSYSHVIEVRTHATHGTRLILTRVPRKYSRTHHRGAGLYSLSRLRATWSLLSEQSTCHRRDIVEVAASHRLLPLPPSLPTPTLTRTPSAARHALPSRPPSPPRPLTTRLAGRFLWATRRSPRRSARGCGWRRAPPTPRSTRRCTCCLPPRAT